tara:strand:+ start:892 stop:993 length:102 start_codon:yes stop_codon:yes gene_type:complete
LEFSEPYGKGVEIIPEIVFYGPIVLEGYFLDNG